MRTMSFSGEKVSERCLTIVGRLGRLHVGIMMRRGEIVEDKRSSAFHCRGESLLGEGRKGWDPDSRGSF